MTPGLWNLAPEPVQVRLKRVRGRGCNGDDNDGDVVVDVVDAAADDDVNGDDYGDDGDDDDDGGELVRDDSNQPVSSLGVGVVPAAPEAALLAPASGLELAALGPALPGPPLAVAPLGQQLHAVRRLGVAGLASDASSSRHITTQQTTHGSRHIPVSCVYGRSSTFLNSHSSAITHIGLPTYISTHHS